MDTNPVNHIIRNKLETIVDLPENYTPDLDTKWEILKLSIHKKSGQKAKWWMIAASIFVIGASSVSLLLINLQNHITIPAEVLVIKKPKVQSLQMEVIEIKKTKKKNYPETSKQKISDSLLTADYDANKSIVSSLRLVDSVMQNPTAAILVSKKSVRFVEIDFGVIDSEMTNKSVVTVQYPVKFQLGHKPSQITSIFQSNNETVTGITIPLISK